MAWTVNLLFDLCVCVPIGFIWYVYIIAPGKIVMEGLSDWWHESDNDL